MKHSREAGQMTIEMILIMVALLGVAMGFSNYARSNRLMASFIEEPWFVVQGMIESGVWKKAKDAKAYHPNLKKRHGTAEGETP